MSKKEISTDTCPHCGAPCCKEVLMRGGEHGWGDDASRTVLRYIGTTVRHAPIIVTDRMVKKYKELHAEGMKLYDDDQRNAGRTPRLQESLDAGLKYALEAFLNS